MTELTKRFEDEKSENISTTDHFLIYLWCDVRITCINPTCILTSIWLNFRFQKTFNYFSLIFKPISVSLWDTLIGKSYTYGIHYSSHLNAVRNSCKLLQSHSYLNKRNASSKKKHRTMYKLYWNQINYCRRTVLFSVAWQYTHTYIISRICKCSQKYLVTSNSIYSNFVCAIISASGSVCIYVH